MHDRWLAALVRLIVIAVGASVATSARATPCDTAACGYRVCAAGVVPVTAIAGDPFTPIDVGSLPLARDISRWSQDMSFHDGRNPFFVHLDVEGDHVYVAENGGLQVWRHTGDAAFPRVGRAFLGSVPGARWCGTPELKHPIQWVDVPDGDGDVAVIGAGMCSLGMLVFDTSTRSAPRFRYQADLFNLGGLWTTRVDGAGYAVAGARGEGLLVYDLDAALAIDGSCRDEAVMATTCGVFLRRLGTMRQLTGVHGTRRYVAASGERIEVFDLISSSDEPLVSWDPGIAGFNLSVAMFAWGGTTLVAAIYFVEGSRTANLGLWDVGPCLAGSCEEPVVLDVASIDGDNLPRFLTLSTRAGVPHLHVGTEFTCVRGEADWLYRVTGTGAGTRLERISVRPEYFGWYYPASSPDGAFDARPRSARFVGDHLYRAMWTFLDVHRWVGADDPVCGDATCHSPGETCAGCPFDCGPCDAPDAGPAADGGAPSPDAGARADAGAPSPDGGRGAAPPGSGCGCRVTAERAPGWLSLAWLAVALSSRRRRDRSAFIPAPSGPAPKPGTEPPGRLR